MQPICQSQSERWNNHFLLSVFRLKYGNPKRLPIWRWCYFCSFHFIFWLTTLRFLSTFRLTNYLHTQMENCINFAKGTFSTANTHTLTLTHKYIHTGSRNLICTFFRWPTNDGVYRTFCPFQSQWNISIVKHEDFNWQIRITVYIFPFAVYGSASKFGLKRFFIQRRLSTLGYLYHITANTQKKPTIIVLCAVVAFKNHYKCTLKRVVSFFIEKRLYFSSCWT